MYDEIVRFRDKDPDGCGAHGTVSDESKVEITVKQAQGIRSYLKMLYPQLNNLGKDDIGCLMDELEIQIRKIKEKEKRDGDEEAGS